MNIAQTKKFNEIMEYYAFLSKTIKNLYLMECKIDKKFFSIAFTDKTKCWYYTISCINNRLYIRRENGGNKKIKDYVIKKIIYKTRGKFA